MDSLDINTVYNYTYNTADGGGDITIKVLDCVLGCYKVIVEDTNIAGKIFWITPAMLGNVQKITKEITIATLIRRCKKIKARVMYVREVDNGYVICLRHQQRIKKYVLDYNQEHILSPKDELSDQLSEILIN